MAGGVVGFPEVGQDGGFVVAVAEVAVEGEGVDVAVGGVGVVAEVVVGVAEAVPRLGLPVAVAYLLEEGEGLLAVGEGGGVVTEQGVVPADVAWFRWAWARSRSPSMVAARPRLWWVYAAAGWGSWPAAGRAVCKAPANSCQYPRRNRTVSRAQASCQA